VTPKLPNLPKVVAEAVAGVIAEAFDEIAPAQWIVPDGGVRRGLLAAQFEILVEHADKHGRVHTLPDKGGEEVEAVAVWYDNTGAEVPEIERYEERLAKAVGLRWLARFKAFDAELLAHHPHRPHFHLALLAVRPHLQARGLGSRLLERQHAWLDERKIPAYLEASSRRTRELYLRHGYEPLGEPYHLPENGPPLFPLWRHPR